jgi:hypothetical protein
MSLIAMAASSFGAQGDAFIVANGGLRRQQRCCFDTIARQSHMADDLVNPLVRQIRERLPWLFSEYGFTIIDYSYDRAGNCSVSLQSEHLQLLFTQDRGFGGARLGARADPGKSYELGFLLLAIQGERPDVGFEGTAALLKSNWPIIIEALGPKLAETKHEYERREQVSRESFERLQSRYKLTPRGFIYKMKQTAAGRVLFRFLRLFEVALILWTLYIVFNRHPP